MRLPYGGRRVAEEMNNFLVNRKYRSVVVVGVVVDVVVDVVGILLMLLGFC